jgi:hypothetical protein
MKWFDKWFAKKCKQAWNAPTEKSNEIDMYQKKQAALIASPAHLESSGINITVYRANGGHVIECRVYDRKTDRSSNGLHIVTDDQNLGEELGKIITFEQIRN